MTNIKRYYISDPTAPKGFTELTYEEYLILVGEEPNRSYAAKLYREQITIDDVPDENRETVQSIVDAKIARFGLYKDQPISPFELQKMIKGVM